MRDFEACWIDLEKKNFLLGKLSDSELDELLKMHSAKFFPSLSNEGRLQLFITEKSSRNAEKVTRIGLILAGVAVGVGLIQVILALVQIRQALK
jgi:hypothetical protein